MPEISLAIEGYEVAGWRSVEVRRSIDEFAASFSLGLAAHVTAGPSVGAIRPGMAAELRYGDELLVSGWLDEVTERAEARAWSLTVTGRSKAGDLVDCAGLRKGGWKNTPLDKIARDLCLPFGVGVRSDVTDMPVEPRFRLEDGETVFEALDRLARDHAMRITSDPDGSVRFTRTGTTVFADVLLERGAGVEAIERRWSYAQRFSQYIFKAQLAASDETYGEAAAAVKFEVADDGVERYRPTVVHSSSQRGGKALAERAAWERNTRAGASLQISIDYVDPVFPERSWENAHGLWRPNTVVAVRDADLQVDGLFLVTGVTLRRDPKISASLELTFPEAYQPEKPPKKRKKGAPSW